MATCGGCGGRVVVGGVRWAAWTCCDQDCLTRLQCGLVDRFLPEDAVRQSIEEVFAGDCPKCRGRGPVDVHVARTVTGMVLAFRVATESLVACSGCGRALKAKAALHCLVLGWWGFKSAIYNAFILSWNVLGVLLTRGRAEPSPSLVRRVKAVLADANRVALVDAVRGDAVKDP